MNKKRILALIMGAIIASGGISQMAVQVYADDVEPTSISDSVEEVSDAELLTKIPNVEGKIIRWVLGDDKVFYRDTLDDIYGSESGLVFKSISDTEAELVSYDHDDEIYGKKIVNIPQKVVIEGKEYTVTSIGDTVFWHNKNLTNVVLPASITKIGAATFKGCKNLRLTALPEGLKGIGDWAFEDCRSLQLTKLPEGLKEISESTFKGCWNLDLKELPGSIVRIGEEAFYDCMNLKLTVLPANLIIIGNRAFAGTAISRITIPATVTELGYCVFDTYSIEGIKLEEGSTLNATDIREAYGGQYDSLEEDEESLEEESFSEQFRKCYNPDLDWDY